MSQGNVFYYIFRLLLFPFALIYGALVWLRNRMYDTGFYSSVRFSVPVISIGNLSTGGTGKTPHVEYLIRLLQYRYRVATMSRGYKRHTRGFLLANEQSNALRIGDEPMQYHLKFPELVVSVAEERMTGIPSLLQRRPGVDVILLDDAYQHRSVKAGMNILITDRSHPYYSDHILPFGNLRESKSAAKRADIIIVSKCPENFPRQQADEMVKRIAPKPHQQVFFTGLRYNMPYDFFTGQPVNIAGTHALLVCGIARPEPLVAFLGQHVTGIHSLPYKDHHYFVSSDLEEIKTAYDNWDTPNKIIVTTEKDATRLRLHYEKLVQWGIAIVILPIEVHVLFGMGEQLDSIINTYVDSVVMENNGGEFPPLPDVGPFTP
ncbi:tetraacyldisaccharide 4'-kinase [Nemorincola caseinilytica]|uniref:Tetraacyldisaccharide 4'-kinase n=1 Tax=Nemorincola caseinilytica TaxID=2054315 RepID=A0ABP8N5V3_9BACT